MVPLGARVIAFISFFGFALVSTASSWALVQYGRLDPIVGALAGIIVFLALAQLRTSMMQAREREDNDDNFKDVRATNSAIQEALEATRIRLNDVTLAFDRKADEQTKKVTGELQLIEGLIREFAEGVGNKSKTAKPSAAAAAASPAASADVATLSDPAMLDLIRRALEENRVDLYLQPIVTLPQRRVRFYEAFTRLRSLDGSVIMPAQYIKVAGPAGLMSVIDNVLLFRCVQIVRRLTQKSREVAVFCNISGQTLNDAEFFPQFLDYMTANRDLASQIIFEFSQATLSEATVAAEANLRALAKLGFRLSLDQMSKLSLDYAKLKRLGFHFLKVRAEMLIFGMRRAGAAVAAEDFKDHLARNGLSLIVERIENEKTVVQLLEYNIDFGQGYLFAQPRPVRELSDVHDPRSRGGAVISPGLARRLAG